MSDTYSISDIEERLREVQGREEPFHGVTSQVWRGGKIRKWIEAKEEIKGAGKNPTRGKPHALDE